MFPCEAVEHEGFLGISVHSPAEAAALTYSRYFLLANGRKSDQLHGKSSSSSSSKELWRHLVYLPACLSEREHTQLRKPERTLNIF